MTRQTKSRFVSSIEFFVCLLVLALSSLVHANDIDLPLHVPWPNFVGFGVGAYPDYIGSDDVKVGAAPLARIGLGGNRFVRLVVNEMRINVIDHPYWRFGVEGLLRLSRKDVDDKVVKKIHSVDNTIDLGLFAGYNWINPKEFRKQAGIEVWGLADVTGTHDGWTAGLSLYGMYPLARMFSISGGAASTYGSGNYMDTYFGVTRKDSIASGLPVFSPDGSIRDVRGWTLLMLHLSKHWHLGAGLMYSRMVGEAEDSPIVTQRGSKDQWVFGGGVLYAW